MPDEPVVSTVPAVIPPAASASGVLATPAVAAETKTNFSLEYVQELRGESNNYRNKAAEEKAGREAAQAQAAEAQKAADAKVADAIQAANQRIIRAELKTEAIKAGMVDLDGLKLADLSKVALDEQGEVTGAADLMKTLKEAKPFLFGVPPASSSNPKEPPKKDEPKSFNAKTATPEELAADARARGLKIKMH